MLAGAEIEQQDGGTVDISKACRKLDFTVTKGSLEPYASSFNLSDYVG